MSVILPGELEFVGLNYTRENESNMSLASRLFGEGVLNTMLFFSLKDKIDS